ncbi:muscle M-line assembly protein unc-89 [Cinnamomum micranthum f. kanehirae]|uniref:Muscle M-line assembly protein unc-89 n=1 Tax=Cinnamomum micranthum f. kanehirae TaxID=337451 RepID=A0A443P952_9MAGN|nr:muscle M-line assembly protein unc-89 [Cinnamomum micranthum f. kanehirae]
MDFHSLSRKDLQTLCKKNKIPANLTNVAMADALQALQIVEGFEDLHLQSVPSTPRLSPELPEKAESGSPDLLRTCRRTSTRTRSVKDPALESAVPLTRTRAKPSTARRRISKEEEDKKEGIESSDSQQIPVESNKGLELPKTPAARNGRKTATGTSVRRKIEAEDEGEKDEKENEIPVAVTGLRTYSTRRSSRLSDKRLEEGMPVSIQKTRGRKQVIKIAALCEEREDSDTKLKMDSQRSDAKEDDKDSSSDFSLPKPGHFPKIGDFVNENGESDSKSETGDYCSEKYDSDPITDGDLSTTVDDCLTEECDSDLSSHQNPASEDASAAIDDLESPLPEEYYHNQGSSKDASALSDDLIPENSSTTENHKLQECEESGTDSVADADFGHEQLKLKPSDQVMLEHEESRDLEELKSSNQVLLECEESMTDDPNADGDLGLDIDPAEKLKSECKKTDPDAGEVDLEISSAAAIHIPEEDGESGGNSIADSSSSVEDLNQENENFDCQDHLVENSVLKLEFAHLSSSMKKLALDYPQDLLVEKIAKSTEFSSSDALNFPDADFLGETPSGNQFLVGSPASLNRKKISAPNPGTPLGSRSRGLSNKKGTAAKTPTRSNIFEDVVDKENKGRESVKREMKVVTVNVGEDKEQNQLDDMSMRQLKKLYKKTKEELVKRSVLQTVDNNRFALVEGKDN